MNEFQHISIIILAGGKSSRMGQDKGLMLLNGKPMVEHVIETAKQITTEIIIVANNDDYKKFGLPIFKDDYQDKGPLGGIYTGLKNSLTEYNLILSCDIPFVKKDLLQFIISESSENDITVAAFKDKTHPLIAVYRKTCESVVKSCIEQNELKVLNLFKKLNTKQVDVSHFDSSNFRNINSENDL